MFVWVQFGRAEGEEGGGDIVDPWQALHHLHHIQPGPAQPVHTVYQSCGSGHFGQFRIYVSKSSDMEVVFPKGSSGCPSRIQI